MDVDDIGNIAVSRGRLFAGFKWGVREFTDGAAPRRANWPPHTVEVDTGRIAALGGQVFYYLGRGQDHAIQRLDVDTGAPPTTFLDLHSEMWDLAVDKNALVIMTLGAVTVAPLSQEPTWTATFPGQNTRRLAIDASYIYVSIENALWRVNRRDRTKTRLAVADGQSVIEAVVSDGTTVYFFASDYSAADRDEDAVTIMRVPASGGAATRVAQLPMTVYSAAVANGVLFAGQYDKVLAIDGTTGRIETVDAGWADPSRLLIDGDFLYYMSRAGVRRVAVTRRLHPLPRLPSCTPVADAPPPETAIPLGTTTRGGVGRITSDETGVYWTEPKAGRIMRAARPRPAGGAPAVPATVVAEHQVDPSDLALAGGRAHWIAGKHDITRAGLAGNGPEVIWRTTRDAHELAARDGALYWVERTPENDDVLMELGPKGGPPRDVFHFSPVADIVADGDSLFLGLGWGGIVRFDVASGRPRILAGTEFGGRLSVTGSFVYWVTARTTVAYRMDRNGGVPQELRLAPRGTSRDVPIRALSVNGSRAIWMARDDFNEPRIAAGDLFGACARIHWSTVDKSATTIYSDAAGVYWAAGNRVMAESASP